MTTKYIGLNTSIPCDYPGFGDTRLYDGSETTYNNGGSATLLLWSNGSAIRQDTLIIVPDLTQIVGTVTGANLWINFTTVSGSHSVLCRRILTSWVVGTRDDADRNGDTPHSCTYTEKGENVNWNTALALGVGTDVSSTTTFSDTVTTTGFKSFTDAQLIADINDMIANPSTNYGWQLYIPAATSQNSVMDSSECTTAANRPYLEVTFTEAAAGITVDGVVCSKVDGVAF